MDFYKIVRTLRRPLAVILAALILFALIGCTAEDISDGLTLAGDIINIIGEIDTSAMTDTAINEDGYYYGKDDVALYIYTYGKLPPNFITKSEAQELGWQGGSVERYLDGAAIGGDVFGNREGLLPKADGRVYFECDIDTNGKSERGEKRIVYSNDGLIYYTPNHYNSFTLLYGEE